MQRLSLKPKVWSRFFPKRHLDAAIKMAPKLTVADPGIGLVASLLGGAYRLRDSEQLVVAVPCP